MKMKMEHRFPIDPHQLWIHFTFPVDSENEQIGPGTLAEWLRKSEGMEAHCSLSLTVPPMTL
uniref:Uncharacterized protein n=1 Tax=Rhizophora mucronata TaxID=61149 RepID=A0A2P2PBM7_RHIMU